MELVLYLERLKMSRYNKFILFSDEMKKKLSKDYKKKKSAVQEIAEYLRQRSYIDGTRVFMENPTQYKHWSFLYFITYTMQYEIQNYFGVIYDEHGVKGRLIIGATMQKTYFLCVSILEKCILKNLVAS